MRNAEPKDLASRRFWWRMLLVVPLLYVCWLAMLATHEFGHLLHALLSGGRVERVEIPLFGFSRTDVSPNPQPLFVAAGGALWGCAIPIALVAAVRPRFRRVRRLVLCFAGFCFVANGGYLAAGCLVPGSDSADLIRFGAPAALLVLIGLLAVAGGLLFWHWAM